MPPVGLFEQLRVALGQGPPLLAAVQAQRLVEQARLQLDETRHVGHQLAGGVVLEGQAKSHQSVAEAVVAREHLHGRERAGVGSAQHQQARAAALQPALPHVRPLQRRRARHQPAHGVRQQVHRPPAGVAFGQGVVQHRGQALRFLLDGAPPIEGELDHLVGGGQVLGQIVIEAADGAVGRHVGRVLAPGQALQTTNDAQAQPDAFTVHRQVAAENARDEDDRRPLRRRAAFAGRCARPGRTTQAVAALSRPGQRANRPEAGGLVLRQAVADRFGRARVAEIGKVRDFAALVEQETGCGLVARRFAWRAAVHRACLHHQVVVGPVEGVGQQGLDPGHDRVALDVAGHHAQLAGQGLVDAVQPLHQRAVGRHGFQAGQQRRVGALAGHGTDEVQQRRRHRNGRQLQRPLEHRDVGVQPPGGQQRAARRAGHTHHALDADVAPPQRVGQLLQCLPLLAVSRRLQLAQRGRVQVRLGAGAGQHLGHQTAARMGQQVHAGAVGQGLRQQQGVVDRAGGQRRVVERIDPAAVMREQFAHALRVLLPELAEGAVGFRKSAVQQHQHRCTGRGRGQALQPLAVVFQRGVQAVGVQPVDAGVDLPVQPLADLAGGQPRRRFGQQVGDDLNAR